jgi:hypothetical protein
LLPPVPPSAPPPVSAPPSPGLKLAKPPAPPPVAGKVHLTAVSGKAEESLQPKAPAQIEAAKAKARRKRKMLIFSAVALLLVALSPGVYFVYQTYFAPPPPIVLRSPPPSASKPAGPGPSTPAIGSGTASTSTISPTAPATTTASLLDQAQTALADRRALEQARIDNILIGKDPPAKRAIDTPPPGTFAPKPDQPSTTTASVPPAMTGSASAQSGIPPAPAVQAVSTGTDASIAFKVWIENVHINGVVVREGKVSVEINNTLVHPGDTLDPSLGIVFDSVDNSGGQHLLIFRDRTGAILSKPY